MYGGSALAWALARWNAEILGTRGLAMERAGGTEGERERARARARGRLL